MEYSNKISPSNYFAKLPWYLQYKLLTVKEIFKNRFLKPTVRVKEKSATLIPVNCCD
jgi:hypothetical protein